PLVFVALKIDAVIDWSWASALVPLWIIHVLGFITTALFSETRYAGPGYILVITGHIFIALRLDEHIDWKWSIIFLPLYQGCILDISLQTFVSALQTLFLGLKLDAIVHWSWPVVLIPTIIVVGGVSALLVVGSVVASMTIHILLGLLALVGSTMLVGLCFGPYLLALLRLETYSYPAIYIVLPWLILFGLAVVVVLLSTNDQRKCLPLIRRLS
ncbi:hypothetical protein ACHHYP_15547, partial [Achlya hypogyna]